MRSDFQLSRLRLDARFTHETLRREVRVAIAFFLGDLDEPSEANHS
jgi:hypothetical protein